MISNKSYYDQMAAGCFCLPSKAGTARCSICWTMRRPCYLTSQACAPCPGLICRFNHKILKPLPFLSWPDMQVTTRINLTFEPFAPYLSWPDLQIILRFNPNPKQKSKPTKKKSKPSSFFMWSCSSNHKTKTWGSWAWDAIKWDLKYPFIASELGLLPLKGSCAKKGSTFFPGACLIFWFWWTVLRILAEKTPNSCPQRSVASQNEHRSKACHPEATIAAPVEGAILPAFFLDTCTTLTHTDTNLWIGLFYLTLSDTEVESTIPIKYKCKNCNYWSYCAGKLSMHMITHKLKIY